MLPVRTNLPFPDGGPTVIRFCSRRMTSEIAHSAVCRLVNVDTRPASAPVPNGRAIGQFTLNARRVLGSYARPKTARGFASGRINLTRPSEAHATRAAFNIPANPNPTPMSSDSPMLFAMSGGAPHRLGQFGRALLSQGCGIVPGPRLPHGAPPGGVGARHAESDTTCFGDPGRPGYYGWHPGTEPLSNTPPTMSSPALQAVGHHFLEDGSSDAQVPLPIAARLTITRTPSIPSN